MSSLKLLLLFFFSGKPKISNHKSQDEPSIFRMNLSIFWFSKVVLASRTQKIWKYDMRLASWPKLTTFKCSIGKRNTCEPWFFKATELYFFLQTFKGLFYALTLRRGCWSQFFEHGMRCKRWFNFQPKINDPRLWGQTKGLIFHCTLF